MEERVKDDELLDQRALSRIKDAKDRARPGMKSCISI